jgi:hypothetical protein
MEVQHLRHSIPRIDPRPLVREEASPKELVSHMESSPSGGVTNPRVLDLETEMAFTPWDQSCKDPHITGTGDLRECRRPANHAGGFHASGFASSRSLFIWTDA